MTEVIMTELYLSTNQHLSLKKPSKYIFSEVEINAKLTKSHIDLPFKEKQLSFIVFSGCLDKLVKCPLLIKTKQICFIFLL